MSQNLNFEREIIKGTMIQQPVAFRPSKSGHQSFKTNGFGTTRQHILLTLFGEAFIALLKTLFVIAKRLLKTDFTTP
ncbi:hypothetical protein [Thiomicrorhabdus sediminis]|uniref:Uncharacterized protein n=1 Tax=Thiomicrorhabdus sediminis TaxID=2580412 RepID=A0A4V1HHT7_9GAMM|nr:hypothetical protein [Thiomicrorhabdus sediminis]QCU90163.1 hypothetical protein FE785_05735 [Thiomicrorhabdus sediminis]